MTLTALPALQMFPSPPNLGVFPSDVIGFRSNTIDANGEYYGIAFQIPAADNGKAIQYVWWRTMTVTTGGDLDVRLEGLDGAGNPDTVLASANANKVVAVGAGDDNQFFFTTLTATHTVSTGEHLCAFIKRQGGTFNGQLAAQRRTLFGTNFPYEVNNTGADGKDDLDLEPVCMAIGYSDNTYLSLLGIYPPDTITQATFNSGDADAENGLKFQVPVPMRAVGLWFLGGADAAGANYSIHLYNAAGVPQHAGANRLATQDIDAEHVGVDNNAVAQTRLFSSAVELAKDTVYRATVEATTANNVKLAYYGVDAAARLKAMPGGANWTWIEDDGVGGWTDNAVRVPLMGLVIDKLDDGAGGAASILGGGNLQGGFA